MKDISIKSLILGAILGLLALIPYFTFLIFLFLFLLCAACTLIYLRKTLAEKTYQQVAFLGMVIGTCASASFFAIFIPCTIILSFIFKNYLSYGLTYLIKFDALWFSILMLFLIMLTCACTNAISAISLKAIEDVNWKEMFKGEK